MLIRMYPNKLVYNNEYNNPQPNFNSMRNTNNYNRTFSTEANQQLSLVAEPSIEYERTTKFLCISSNNRDTVNYPLHYDYRVNLTEPHRNVKSIEMISATLPNQSGTNILDEPCLLIDIPEINCIEAPNISTNINCFSILPMKNATKTTGGFINPELGCMFRTANYFKIPITISSLTIKIRDIYGNLYDFGSPSGSTDKAYINSFVFKIVTEEPVRKGMNVRNIY